MLGCSVESNYRHTCPCLQIYPSDVLAHTCDDIQKVVNYINFYIRKRLETKFHVRIVFVSNDFYTYICF